MIITVCEHKNATFYFGQKSCEYVSCRVVCIVSNVLVDRLVTDRLKQTALRGN